MYSFSEITDCFNELAAKDGEKLSSIRLCGFLCLAQFYSLSLTNKRLFKENIRANRYGPEINGFKKYKEVPSHVDQESVEYEIISSIWKTFKSYKEEQLEFSLTKVLSQESPVALAPG